MRNDSFPSLCAAIPQIWYNSLVLRGLATAVMAVVLLNGQERVTTQTERSVETSKNQGERHVLRGTRLADQFSWACPFASMFSPRALDGLNGEQG